MFGGWVSPEEIGVDDVDIASFIERLLDLVEEVLAHDVVVELLSSTDIESESSDFASDFAVQGFVAVIFGTC